MVCTVGAECGDLASITLPTGVGPNWEKNFY